MSEVITKAATPKVKANQNGEKKVRQPRKPRNYDATFKRVLKMPLKVRVELKKQLIASIASEVETIQKAAQEALEFVND